MKPRDYTDTCPGCHYTLHAESMKRLIEKSHLHRTTCPKYDAWSHSHPSPRKRNQWAAR